MQAEEISQGARQSSTEIRGFDGAPRADPKPLGKLSLLSAAAAGLPLLYIPNVLIVDGNAAATAHNILASEMIFRGCIVSIG